MSVFSMGYNIEIRNGKKATYYYREDLKKWVLNLKRLLNIALAGALIQLWKNK